MALCAGLLAVATALSLVGFWTAVAPSPTETGGAGARAIQRFYGAANATVSGRDGAAIEAAVDASVSIYRAGGIEIDAAAFAADLAAIGRATPGLRFAPVAIVANGDRAAAQVAMRGPAGTVAEGPAFFRLEGGRIAAIWDGLHLDALPRALPPATLPAWHGPTPVVLARLTLPAGAVMPEMAVPGPHLLVPEAGELDVVLGGRAAVQIATTDAWRAVEPGKTVRLRPGDALLVDPGVPHLVRNGGPDPVATLGLAVLPAMSSIGAASGFTVAHDLYGGEAGATIAGNGGVATTILAAGTGLARFDPCANGPVTLTVTRATLPAGEAIPARAVRGVQLAAIAVAGAMPAAPASVQPASDGGSRAQTASSIRPTDQGLAASDRVADEIRNPTGHPLDVTTFELAPAGSDGCTR